METGLIYLVIFGIVSGTYNSRKHQEKFHFAKFTLSVLAVFFIPGLAVAFRQGLLLFFSGQALVGTCADWYGSRIHPL
jgi:hypothetical protein